MIIYACDDFCDLYEYLGYWKKEKRKRVFAESVDG
jgi:hypothetical protein